MIVVLCQIICVAFVLRSAGWSGTSIHDELSFMVGLRVAVVRR